MTAAASAAAAGEQAAPCATTCRARSGTGAGDHNIYIAQGSESYRLNIINWLHVAGSYFPYIIAGILALLVLQSSWTLQAQGVTGADVLATASAAPAHLAQHWYLYTIAGVALLLLLNATRPAVYLMDFAVYQPPAEWKVSQQDCVDLMRKYGCYTDESLSFMERILKRSGTGEATHWPPGTSGLLRDPTAKLDVSMQAARGEAECVIFGVMDDLIAKTGLNPKAIDFLVVNCSLFCPTPSLAAMVEQKYNLRRDVRSFNIGGMGCSAGLISVDLAKSLLESRPNSTAVVISTEIITPNMYTGNRRNMLVQNTLFRVGGAAVLLTNKPMDAWRAKYKLLHTVRTQNAEEDAFNAVYQCQDDEGLRGVRLSKEITKVAGRGLKDNLTLLGPHVLPLREQIKVVSVSLWRALLKWAHGKHGPAWAAALLPDVSTVAPYVPDFKLGIHHFCIHAGGRAVIDGVEANLGLSPEHLAPSRNTLWHYGNTSSSSVWYEMAYVEAEEARFAGDACKHKSTRHVKQGERVLQIAFGSGFKVNSAVWVRLTPSRAVTGTVSSSAPASAKAKAE